MKYDVNFTQNQTLNSLFQAGLYAFPAASSQQLPGASVPALNDSLIMSREMQTTAGEPGAYAAAGNVGALTNASANFQSSLMPIFMQLMSQMLQMMTQTNLQGNQNNQDKVDGKNEQNVENDQKAVNQKDGADAADNNDRNIKDPDKKQIAQLLDAAAKKYGIPPDILKAVAHQESGWDPKALSFDGQHGKGVMQIDDRFHKFASTQDVFDPEKNIDYGAKYLKGLYDQYGSWEEALHHYNGGSTYAGKVMALAEQKPWENA